MRVDGRERRRRRPGNGAYPASSARDGSQAWKHRARRVTAGDVFRRHYVCNRTGYGPAEAGYCSTAEPITQDVRREPSSENTEWRGASGTIDVWIEWMSRAPS